MLGGINNVKTVTIILLAAGIFILSGCTTPEPDIVFRPEIDWNDAPSIARAIRVEQNTRFKTTIIQGPNSASGTSDTALLRAWKSEEQGNITYQIYLVDFYDGNWHEYDRATDANGNLLSVSLYSRDDSYCDPATCSRYEQLVIEVSREYLEKNQKDGLIIRLSGPGGKEAFFLSPAYVQAFLSVVR
uniref:Uncharacterized protein n=1 Tax=Candidatus Nitrotoga fabula TaxID=2182327 RepID=A0A2X0QWE4_9PROT|nr:protein of unknown function [Candidatus Nitrotoga fabula]